MPVADITPIQFQPQRTLLHAALAGLYSMGESPFRADTSQNVRSYSAFCIAPTLNSYVAHKMGSVPDVERVLAKLQDRTLYVTVVVNHFNPAVHTEIFRKEESIIDEFEMFDFDFEVISREGQDISECLTDPSLRLIFMRS